MVGHPICYIIKIITGMNIRSVYLTIALGAITTFSSAASLQFETLKCDNMVTPISVESTNPTLSWVVSADGYNRSQLAYQILVASSEELLSERKADMWNSRKVVSSQSTFVEYGGKALQPTKEYYWMVKIWDEKGEESEWSQPTNFEMGLMDASRWSDSKWISLDRDSRLSEHRYREYLTSGMAEPTMVTSQSAAYFRDEVSLDKQVVSARAYVCGLGYYELYINGDKVGDHLLDPAPSNYDKQTYYVTYDVTDVLQKGDNVLGIMVGNGFYGQDISWKSDPESEKSMSYGAPAVNMFIDVKYSDGTEQTITTDQSWRNATGPIVFDNIYGGEIYDARYEIEGWDELNFDDSKWGNAKIVEPELDNISAQNIPPIRNIGELTPQRIFQSAEGEWIVDFGKNIAGWIRIAVQGVKGQQIVLTTTEALTKDGTDIHQGTTGGGANGMSQWLKYICKGEGIEVWEPSFTYHGFRYAKVAGLSTKPTKESLTAIVVATDLEQNGSFSCSDPLYNQMDEISRWTIVNNMHGIPEDCPHREKCGWLGDAHAFCEYALYNYDLLNFYKKYMEDIRTQRRAVVAGDGSSKKFLIPTMIAPGKRTSGTAFIDWGVASIYLPWYNYLHTGDKAMVVEYYEDMKEMTDYYLTFKDKDGIMQNGMGDWCPPNWDRKQNPAAMECDKIVSANAYFYDVLGIMAKFARMNGEADYAEQMTREQKALGEAFNRAYLTTIPLVNAQWYGSQTATVMALQFGMVPEDKLEKVVQGLVYDIEAVKGTHHAVGIHGMRYIYTVLNKYGREELSHAILTTPTFPSQTYVMNYGFTTWPERQFYWDEMDQVSNSLNHPMHSGFAAYFYESLGGVKSCRESVGYREFTVEPIYPKSMESVSVDVPTSYGEIHNDWSVDGDIFNMNLQVPFNTKARVKISERELESLVVNGAVYSSQIGEYNDQGELLLGSGSYNIKYYVDYE